VRGAALTLCLACAACAARSYETQGAYAPADAAKVIEKGTDASLALVRGGRRTPLPQGTRIEGEGRDLRATTPSGPDARITHSLEDGDAVVVDEQDRIVAIRRKGGDELRFEPGTAAQTAGSDEIVVTRRAGAVTQTPLEAGDRVEVVARWHAGETLPDGRRVVERPRVAMLVGGALAGAVGYVPALVVGATSPLTQDRTLLLPVLGPWIDLLARPACKTPPNDLVGMDPCSPETAIKAGLVASGVLQALGAVLLGFGMAPEVTVVANEEAQVSVGPLGAHGHF
jgi:hypothetical protein